MGSSALAVDPETELIELVARYVNDPLGFVLAAYPWGEEGPLKDHAGPDEWQTEFLSAIGKECRANKFNGFDPVRPIRRAVSSGHGIGKSTIASQFPRPIFISTEEGIDQLDVTSFPKAQAIGDVVASIKTLLKEDHEFKTVVVDSVDWLVEPLIVDSVNSQYDEKAQAYGKGSMYIAEEFREILQGLDALRLKKGMNVVLIAHAAVVKYLDPRTDEYDKFQPKLPKACNALLQEWVDIMAFAAFKIIIKKSDAKGFDAGVPDGVMGPATRAGLRRFQQSIGTVADGYPTHALLERLQAPR